MCVCINRQINIHIYVFKYIYIISQLPYVYGSLCGQSSPTDSGFHIQGKYASEEERWAVYPGLCVQAMVAHWQTQERDAERQSAAV